ncbi:MAG: DUF3703 domain-containing protein [Novosphingobium sp.]|nr:DUF3703 domain-containing protein [Novosphingobium sp.]
MTRDEARALIAEEAAVFRVACADRDSTTAWQALERTHIVSQPYLTLHLASHCAMLRYALHERDLREAIGQCLRIVLAPLGAISGRLPVGNTGRAKVSAFRPMPIPQDLLARMNDKS